MSSESQAVLLNAIPLLALAALYLLATTLVGPSLWRTRPRLGDLGTALALALLCVGVATAILGVLVLEDRRPLAGNAVVSLLAIALAVVPALVTLAARRPLSGGGAAALDEDERSERQRDREAVNELVAELARGEELEVVARLVVERAASLLGVDFAALAVVDDGEARGVAATADGRPVDWWTELRLDVEREPSAIASVVFEAAPLVVYDVPSSPLVNRRLAERVGANSAAFVPLLAAQRVVGVLVAATTRTQRAFSARDLGLLQELAAESALAVERTRATAALESALERERLVARVSQRVRSEVDLSSLLLVSAEETARALAASRCLITFARGAAPMRIEAEWYAPGLEPAAQRADDLPVARLAIVRGTTVAVGDVESASELTPAGRRSHREIGSGAVLATPLVALGETIGAFSLHRREPSQWSLQEIALAEAVAHEVALAVHTARLLSENETRLRQRSALLDAAQAVTSELRLETVLQRLVDEVAGLLGGEAADCYLLDERRGVLRCAAVHGLPAELLGTEFPATAGLSGQAIASGRPAIATDYAAVSTPVPNEAYRGFVHAIVAPVIWSGSRRGVLGVGTADPQRAFDDDAAETLAAFATLAAVALRNAEAFEERMHQAGVLRGFYRIASVLGEPLALGETLDAVAQAASEALGGSFAAVLMPRAGTLALAGGQDVPAAVADVLAHGLPETEAALATAAREQRVLAARDVRSDERFEREWRALAEEVDYRSLLVVPVSAAREGEPNGLVLVFFADERLFSDDDLELAEHLARASRGALERSRLYEEERIARSLAQELAQTGGRLATELDPAAVLDRVVEQAPRLVGADACAIRLLEDDELVVAAVDGIPGDVIGARSRARSPLSGEVVQTHGAHAVDDTHGDDRLFAADPILALGFRAFIGVPLAAPEGGLHGVLALYARAPKSWRGEEVEALLALAANASAALSNAELYQRVAFERERSLAILTNIADGIVAVDRDGAVVVWNHAAEQITGVPRADALGRTLLELLGRRLESEGEVRGGNRLVPIRRGGEDVWLSLSEAVMRDPAGAVAGRIFAFRDISAERLVEQIKSDFVATVSQELRRPLTSIYGFAETLLRQDVYFRDEDRRTFLGYIASESERLATIVDALLNVARLDAGDLQVNLAPTDVSSVVSDVVTSAEQAVPLDGHRFVVDLPAEPLAAQADADKLRQVLANLIENAVKYSPSGGTVTVSARRTDAAVEVSVADEGIGIPQAEQQRIFRKFYRGEGAPRRSADVSGAGLGLFIVEGLVSAMGGHVSVRSAEGAGSTFTVALPSAADGGR